MLGVASEIEKDTKHAAQTLLDMMRAKIQAEQPKMPLRVLGPVRCAYGKINGKYRYRIILKCKNTSEFRKFIRELLQELDAYRDFARVHVFADINGDIGV